MQGVKKRKTPLKNEKSLLNCRLKWTKQNRSCDKNWGMWNYTQFLLLLFPVLFGKLFFTHILHHYLMIFLCFFFKLTFFLKFLPLSPEAEVTSWYSRLFNTAGECYVFTSKKKGLKKKSFKKGSLRVLQDVH